MRSVIHGPRNRTCRLPVLPTGNNNNSLVEQAGKLLISELRTRSGLIVFLLPLDRIVVKNIEARPICDMYVVMLGCVVAVNTRFRVARKGAGPKRNGTKHKGCFSARKSFGCKTNELGGRTDGQGREDGGIYVGEKKGWGEAMGDIVCVPSRWSQDRGSPKGGCPDQMDLRCRTRRLASSRRAQDLLQCCTTDCWGRCVRWLRFICSCVGKKEG